MKDDAKNIGICDRTGFAHINVYHRSLPADLGGSSQDEDIPRNLGVIVPV